MRKLTAVIILLHHLFHFGSQSDQIDLSASAGGTGHHFHTAAAQAEGPQDQLRALDLLHRIPRQGDARALFEGATGESYMSDDNTMHVHMSNIRKKIARFTDELYIETVYGMGYCLLS